MGLEACKSTLGMKDEILKPMYHHRHVQAFNGVGMMAVNPVFRTSLINPYTTSKSLKMGGKRYTIINDKLLVNYIFNMAY